MKQIVKYLISLNFIIIQIAYPQWVEQNSGVTVDLYDVCFVDSLHGWVVGDSVTILNTIDGGDTWIKQYNSDSLSREYKGYKIKFINKNVGLCGGDNGVLLSTVDGGNTWIETNLITKDDITDIALLNETTAWITTVSHSRVSKVLKTSDLGNSWNTQIVGSEENGLKDLLITAIVFQDSLNGWFNCGYYYDNFNGVLFYKTNNSGETWEFISEIDWAPLPELKIASKDTLWAGGYAAFSISSDGGMKWEDTNGLPRNNASFQPIGGHKGWAYQHYIYENMKKIYYTKDGWISFVEDYTPLKSIMEMTSNSKNHLWGVGLDGYIIKRTGIPTSIQDLEKQDTNFYLAQNYPNPFNPRTKIYYQLPTSMFVQLKVYDALGREVETLVNKVKSAGKHQIEYNAENFKSGVYYYQLQNKNISITKKMLLLR